MTLRCQTGGHWAWGIEHRAWSWTISDCGFSILDTGY